MRKKLLYFFVAIVVLILAIGKCASDDTPTTSTTTTTVDKWYNGGTLHKAKISDWKKATEQNKLATCGDFVASANNKVSMEEIKIRATALKNCINEATIGVETTNDESVASIEAMCIVVLGY